MERWTDAEFQRVALSTQLGRRTLDACRDVLVNGLSGKEAGARHQMFPSQISRAITTLREKQASVLELASVRNDSHLLQRMIATEAAKALFGQGFTIRDAEAGHAYQGPIVVQTAAFMVQRVGTSGVLHDLARFERLPPMHKDLQISYPQSDGLALFNDVESRREQKSGPER